MTEIISFFDHTLLGWIAKVAVLLGGLYWLFTKKFVGEYAKQTVELMFTKEKTSIESAVKAGFDEQLVKLKSELDVEVATKIQPLVAQLNIITNKQGVIFNLEKETIVEFNAAITEWLWDVMQFEIPDYNAQNLELLTEKRKKLNAAYTKTRLCTSKISLVVDDSELIACAHEAVMKCLALEGFIDTILSTIHIYQSSHSRDMDMFWRISNDPKLRDDTMLKSIGRDIDESVKIIREAKEKYKNEYMPLFKVAQEQVTLFNHLAKAYLKK